MCSGWWFIVIRQNRWSSASVTRPVLVDGANLELLQIAAIRVGPAGLAGCLICLD
jgi:hypothetical protein